MAWTYHLCTILTFKDNVSHDCFAKAQVSHNCDTLIQDNCDANGCANDLVDLLLAVVLLLVVDRKDLYCNDVSRYKNSELQY
jgi:hypothetical protein